jgi:exonuclease SbcD
MPRLLAIGDVHLGTRPRAAGEGETGIDIRDLTPAAALDRAVTQAIDEGVDAVVFAGDVVDSTNSRFEAYAPLAHSVKALLDAGIDVLGVVGNHDVEALPRLAAQLPEFKLVGAGGRWESVPVVREGRTVFEIVGWSFPQPRVSSSPVADLARANLPAAQAGVPRVGVLHCDLDASGGPYAPVTTAELAASGIDTWLLGHIHKPSLTPSRVGDAGPRIGYLGSLVGLNPKETGDRGPWLADFSSGAVALRQVVNPPLRWDEIDLAVEPEQSVDDLGDAIFDALDREARALHAREIEPRVLGLRIRLTGATKHFAEIEKWVADQKWSVIDPRSTGPTTVVLNKVRNATEVARDLEDLARSQNPPGLLAKRLLLLETGGPERAALIEAARTKLRSAADESAWTSLQEVRDPADPLSDEAIVRTLKAAGTSALNKLLSQKSDPEQSGEAER